MSKEISINATEVNVGMTDTLTASSLLQVYTNTVNTTPDIILPKEVDELSNSKVSIELPEHQELARENATYYMKEVNPALLSQSSHIIGFSNLWNAQYKHLISLAENIDVGDNKKKFIDGINNLIKNITVKKDGAQKGLNALLDFLPKIQKDKMNFTSNSDSVELALSGEEGAIAELNKTIEACNNAIDKDIAVITNGSMVAVGGIVMITSGAITVYEGKNKKKGVKTIIKGVATVTGGSAAMGFAIKDLEKQQKTLAKAINELNYDMAVQVALTMAKCNIDTLVDAVDGGITAISSLINGWTNLVNNLQEIVELLEQADPDLGSWLIETLEAANLTWNDTLVLAKSLQQNGLLPVVETKYDIAA